MKSVDVLVIGAGSAGSTLAWKCATHGLSVLVVDARKRDHTGARWCNGVEKRLFRWLELDPPAPPILHQDPSVIYMESATGHRLTVYKPPLFDIDMVELTEMLTEKAEEAGAEFQFERRFVSPIIEHRAVVGAQLRHSGSVESVRAMVTVDAAGMDGSLRVELPETLWDRETIQLEDICIAHQQVMEISDLGAAQDYLDSQGIRSGETLCWSSLRGGYSLFDLNVDLERGQISMLAGAMRSQGRRAAKEILEDGTSRLGFVGSRIMGAGGLIPVRRAFNRLVGDGYALLGDAASQVFPAHGSGVASGMGAATILARTLSLALAKHDADTRGLWPYAVEYQSKRGGLCASYEFVRRFSERLSPEDLDAMFQSGVVDAETTRRALGCRSLHLSLHQVGGMARLTARSPRLAKRLLLTASRVNLVMRHYRRYPVKWDPFEFGRWCRRTGLLFK